jgi:hypothetical protein
MDNADERCEITREFGLAALQDGAIRGALGFIAT